MEKSAVVTTSSSNVLSNLHRNRLGHGCLMWPEYLCSDEASLREGLNMHSRQLLVPCRGFGCTVTNLERG